MSKSKRRPQLQVYKNVYFHFLYYTHTHTQKNIIQKNIDGFSSYFEHGVDILIKSD